MPTIDFEGEAVGDYTDNAAVTFSGLKISPGEVFQDATGLGITGSDPAVDGHRLHIRNLFDEFGAPLPDLNLLGCLDLDGGSMVCEMTDASLRFTSFSVTHIFYTDNPYAPSEVDGIIIKAFTPSGTQVGATVTAQTQTVTISGLSGLNAKYILLNDQTGGGASGGYLPDTMTWASEAALASGIAGIPATCGHPIAHNTCASDEP